MANLYATALESGSSQSWSIADASQTGLDFAGDMSISLWVKLESQPASGNSMYIVSKYADPSSFSYRFTYQNNSGTPRLIFSTSSNGSSNSNVLIDQTLSNGVTYHLGVSKSGTTAHIYVNGASIGSGTVTNTIFDSTAAFGVGTTADVYYDGVIDDVIVYSAAIGDAGMEQNYDTPCDPYLTNAVSRWEFENNGDDSIGSNDLTNNNSATFVEPGLYSCAAASRVFMIT